MNPVASFRCLGGMIFDLAFPKSDRKEFREIAADRTAQFLTLIALGDALIDESPRTVDEVRHYLDNVRAALFEGKTSETGDEKEDILMDLARDLHTDLMQAPLSGELCRTYDAMAEGVILQRQNRDAEALFAIAQQVGGAFVESIACIAEIVAGEQIPQVREAARRLGVYGQILDDLTDVAKDQEEGIRTFVSVRLESGERLAAISRDSLSFGNKLVKDGALLLERDADRLRVYWAIKSLQDLKYSNNCLVSAVRQLAKRAGEAR